MLETLPTKKELVEKINKLEMYLRLNHKATAKKLILEIEENCREIKYRKNYGDPMIKFVDELLENRVAFLKSLFKAIGGEL